MSNIAIIPARAGSKRIPDKNIFPILGKPAIAYAISTAFNSGLFTNIFVWPTAISPDAAILISVIFAGTVEGFASTDGADDGVGLACGDGVIGTGIGTPLFQINFLPDYDLEREFRLP